MVASWYFIWGCTSMRMYLIWWTNVMIGILDPACDAKIYHLKYMWVSAYISWSSDFDISWRLLEDYYEFNVTQTLNWNYICRPVTYISWSRYFALYLDDYLMDKCHSWNIGPMWCKDKPHKMYVGQWPTIRDSDVLMEECWIEYIDSVRH